MAVPSAKRATLYRMVTDQHICPFGLKARRLLRSQGYAVDDRQLTTREATDAFKAEQGVATTPQVFIGGERIGGYDDLRRHLGAPVRDPQAKSYAPVIVVFAATAAMALAAGYATSGVLLSARSVQWFVCFSLVVLAVL